MLDLVPSTFLFSLSVLKKSEWVLGEVARSSFLSCCFPSAGSPPLLLLSHAWCSLLCCAVTFLVPHGTEECAIQRQCNREWDLGGLWSVPSSPHQPRVETGSAHAEHKSFWGSLHIFLFFISLLLGCCEVSWSLGIISMCGHAAEQL